MDKKLLEIYVKWEEELEVDEWYFSNSFDSITKGMSREEAFNYIPNVIEMLLKLDNDYLVWQTLYFLIQLYGLADTTQIHPFQETKWSMLTKHIQKYADSYATPFGELKRNLRIRK